MAFISERAFETAASAYLLGTELKGIGFLLARAVGQATALPLKYSIGEKKGQRDYWWPHAGFECMARD